MPRLYGIDPPSYYFLVLRFTCFTVSGNTSAGILSHRVCQCFAHSLNNSTLSFYQPMEIYMSCKKNDYARATIRTHHFYDSSSVLSKSPTEYPLCQQKMAAVMSWLYPACPEGISLQRLLQKDHSLSSKLYLLWLQPEITRSILDKISSRMFQEIIGE